MVLKKSNEILKDQIIIILLGSIFFIIFIPFFLGQETGVIQCEGDVCFPEIKHESVWELFLQHVKSYEPCESELGFLTCLVIQDQTLPQIFGYFIFIGIVIFLFRKKKQNSRIKRK